MKLRFLYRFFPFAFLILCFTGMAGGAQLAKDYYRKIPGEAIRQPKPTHMEGPYVMLKTKLVQKESLNDKYFLVRPGNLAVDDAGNVYTFDAYQQAVIRFDSGLRAVGSFGRGGDGPGEFTINRMGRGEVYIRGNRLYASDPARATIHCFSIPDGRFVRDIRLQDRRITSFLPLADERGNFFILSGYKQGIVDKFFPDGRLAATYLKAEYSTVMRRSLFAEMKEGNRLAYVVGKPMTVFLHHLGADRLLVFLAVPSRMLLVEKGRVTLARDLWPKNALGVLRGSSLKGCIQIFVNLIADQDDPRYFYLQNFHFSPKGWKALLYQFDLSGNLARVLAVPTDGKKNLVFLHAKRFGRFYGVVEDTEKHLVVYEEIKK